MFPTLTRLMSKIGKKPVKIPDGVDVSQIGQTLRVVGPLGELSRVTPPSVTIFRQDNMLRVIPLFKTPFHGTVRAYLQQMMIGVTLGWMKELEIHGIGYRTAYDAAKHQLTFKLGFAHDVVFPVPPAVKVQVSSPTFITLSGNDKLAVTLTAAKIRMLRKPEPYKGKGIRYFGETIRLLPGKKK